jgi:hypothetical protein
MLSFHRAYWGRSVFLVGYAEEMYHGFGGTPSGAVSKERR